jgi:hypothetical protein
VGALVLLFLLSHASADVTGKKLEKGTCVCVRVNSNIYLDACGPPVFKTVEKLCLHYAGEMYRCGNDERFLVKLNDGMRETLHQHPALKGALGCKGGPHSCQHDEFWVDGKDLTVVNKAQCIKKTPRGKNKQGKKKAKGDGNKDCKPDGHMKVEYTVKPGDTLTAIAKKFGVSVKQIVRDNHIKYPDIIFVGQQLCINKAKKANP